MKDKEFYVPDELTVPEELHVPREFTEVPDPFTVGPFCIAPPTEFVSDEKVVEEKPKASEEYDGSARRKKNLMEMMYLAALMTSMAASVSVYSTQKENARFDMAAFIRTHQDWVDESGNEHLYLGDDGWGYIASTGNENGAFAHTDFRRFKLNTLQIDEYSCMNYSIEWDWESVAMKRNEAVTKFVKTDDGYILEVYEPSAPDLVRKFSFIEPDKVSYECKDDMRAILNMNLQTIINKYSTYKLFDDAPVYDDFSNIVFNPDGTGTIYTRMKKLPFTYKLEGDAADNSIHMYIDGEYTYAALSFDSGLIGLRLFEREGNGSFGYFVAEQKKDQRSVTPSQTVIAATTTQTTKEDDHRDDEFIKPVFNIEEYIYRHRDWKSGSMYIYFGENGWGYIARPGAGNEGHTDFRRFKMTASRGEEPVLNCHSFEWDGQSASLDSRDFKLRFIEDGENYVIELERPGVPNNIRFSSIAAEEADYEGHTEMRAVLDQGMRQILGKYNSYHVENADDVKDNFNKMVFFSDGTGFMYMNGEEHPFTYNFSGDTADQSIYMYVDGKYTYAHLTFDGGLVAIRLFGHIEDPGHFGYFMAD